MVSPPVLVITGTPSGNDTIHVTETAGQISVDRVSISDLKQRPGGLAFLATEPSVAASSFGSIQIIPGQGNDFIRTDASVLTPATVYPGSGSDTIIAGGGNENTVLGDGQDTVIALGGNHTVVAEGNGADTFWVDSRAQLSGVTNDEKNNRMVRVIESFALEVRVGYATVTPGLTPDNPALRDPISDDLKNTAEKSFASDPLFSNSGPTLGDVNQGAVGDRQTLAALRDIAGLDPSVIRQSIVALGDGTYAVDFKPNGVNGPDTDLRINADLPVNYAGNPVYAQPGARNSLWVAPMEKAWTFERPTPASWTQVHQGHDSMIDGGGPGEIFGQLGLPFSGMGTGYTLGKQAILDIEEGTEVVIGTNATINDNSGLLGAHDDWVVGYDSLHGDLLIRNAHGGPNAHQEITLQKLIDDISGGCVATV